MGRQEVGGSAGGSCGQFRTRRSDPVGKVTELYSTVLPYRKGNEGQSNNSND